MTSNFTKVFVGALFFSLFVFIDVKSQGILTVGQDDTTKALNNLLVEAQVLLKGKPLEGVNVGVKGNDEILLVTKTNEKGFFKIELNFDTLYVLEFRKAGYITKSVEIDTRNMPIEDKEYGYDLGLFKLSMLKNDEGTASLYLEPVARFHYSEITQIFVFDKKHKKEVKKRFEEKDIKPDIIKF